MSWTFWAMFVLFLVMTGLCFWERYDNQGEDTVAIYVRDS